MTIRMLRGPSRRSGVAQMSGGSFVTDGASNPSQIGGEVVQVLRLEDAGARPFFRIRLKRVLDIDQLDVSVCTGVRSTNPLATAYTVTVGPCTAAPVLARRADEFDVALLAVGGTYTDAAGNRIDFQILGSR